MVEDVLGELDAENEGDSEDDFDRYVDIDDEMGEEHENVGANVEISEVGMEIGECEQSEGDATTTGLFLNTHCNLAVLHR